MFSPVKIGQSIAKGHTATLGKTFYLCQVCPTQALFASVKLISKSSLNVREIWAKNQTSRLFLVKKNQEVNSKFNSSVIFFLSVTNLIL